MNSQLSDSFEFEADDKETDFKNQTNDEIVRLKQHIVKIEEENASLRSQFEDILKVSSDMDNVFNINTELQKKNRNLQAEIDDLTKRLQISFNVNKELQEKAEKDKASVKMYLSNESNNYQQQLNEFQEKADAQIQSLTNEIEVLKRQNKQTTDENGKISAEIQNTLKLAENKFHSSFPSLISLNNFLKGFEYPQPISQNQSFNSDAHFAENLKMNSNNLNNKYLKLKNKCHKLLNIRNSLENENESLIQQIKNLKDEYESKRKSIENEVNDIKRQKKFDDAQNEQEKEKLKSTINRLQNKINKLATKNEEIMQSANDMSSKLISAEESSNNLQKQQDMINGLENELKKAQKDKEKYKKQNQALFSKIEEVEENRAKLEEKLKSNKEKYETNVNMMKAKIDETDKENLDNHEKIKKLEAQNENYQQNINQLKSNISSLQSKSSNAANSIASLQSLISKQNVEISNLSQIKDNLSSALQKQQSIFAVYESEFKKLLDKNNDLLMKIESENRIKKEPRLFDGISESAWICMDLPKDLCDEVAEIGRITIQPIDQRLKQCLSVIATYIQDKMNSWKKKDSEYNAKYSSLYELLKQLLLALNIQIGEPNIEADELIRNQGLIDEISRRLDNLNSRYNGMNCRVVETVTRGDVNPSLQQLLDSIGTTDIQSAEVEVEKMKRSLDEQNNEIKKLVSKNKRIKNSFHQIANDLNDRENQIREMAEQERARIEEIQQSLDDKIDECESLKSDIDKLNNEIANRDEQHKEDLETSKTEQLDMTKSICQKMKNDCDLQLRRKDQELIKAQKEAEKAQHTIDKLKARNEQLKEQIDEKIAQCEKLEESISQIKKSTKDQHAIQLKNINEQCNEAIDNLKNELQQKEDEIQKSKKRVKDAMLKCDQLTESKNSLMAEKQQLLNRIDAKKKELENEKKLSATKLKAISLSSDMKLRNETETLKMDFEQQKREIFHYAAEVFKQFFDPRMQMTEATYKAILQNARTKLDLSAQQDEAIRKMLGIVGNENIESALLQLLPKNSQKKQLKPQISTFVP